MSKYFILDKEESFWQSDIYRKAKRHGMNHAFKTKPQGVTLMIKKLSIKDNDIKQSYLQAFFTKKDIFSSKTSFGLLIFRKIFNVNYRKEKRQNNKALSLQKTNI